MLTASIDTRKLCPKILLVAPETSRAIIIVGRNTMIHKGIEMNHLENSFGRKMKIEINRAAGATGYVKISNATDHILTAAEVTEFSANPKAILLTPKTTTNQPILRIDRFLGEPAISRSPRGIREIAPKM